MMTFDISIHIKLPKWSSLSHYICI